MENSEQLNAEAQARHRKEPEKRKARAKVSEAIRTGKLTKQPCETCGYPEAQAHHEDYSKPLEVNWLCSVCHGARHRAKEKEHEQKRESSYQH